MQKLLSPKEPDSAALTVRAIEKWERHVNMHATRFSKVIGYDVKIGVALAMSPVPVQSHDHLDASTLNTYPAVRAVTVGYCKKAADFDSIGATPMDIGAFLF